MKNQKQSSTSVIPLHHKVLLWWLVVQLALGQFQRMQLTTEIAVYIHEIVLLISIGVAFIEQKSWRGALQVERWRLLLRSAWTPFVVWTISITVLHAFWQLDVVPILYLIRLSLLAAGAWSLRVFFRQHPQHLRAALISLGVLWAGLGMLQYVLIPDTRFLLILGWDEHYYRLIGTLFDPAFTGMLLVLAYLLVLKTQLRTSIKIFCLSLLASACLLTYSRSSYGSLLIVGMGALFVSQLRAFVPIALSAFIAVVILLLAPKPGGEGIQLARTASVTARTTQISQLLAPTNTATAIFGEGLFAKHTNPAPAQSQPIAIPYHARLPDNLFLLLWRGTGLVGLILLGFGLLRSARQLFWNQPYQAIALSSIIWHSQFNNTLLHPFVLLYFLLGFFGSERTAQTKV